jgi:D-inositol-3-phosphate glycosyltransferase
MKRIAFISEHASPLSCLGGVDGGGQNVYVGELAKQLGAQGYYVDIFTRKENEQSPRCVQWNDYIRIIHVDAGPATVIPKEEILPFMPAFRDDMLAFMAQEHIDYELIHANFFMSGLVAMQIKALLDIPFVVTFHALGQIRRIHQREQDKFPPERIAIEEEVMRHADHIIAECPQDREDLRYYYDAPADKITVIPCGVNLEELYPIDKLIARRFLQLPRKEFIILQLGRMVPRKGVDNVIEALARIDRKHNVKLVVVGGECDNFGRSKELERLSQLAKDRGVLSRVQFAGQRERRELKYYYAAADLFITTPWYEPFGITPLEAMACGTPVIGSNVGGIKYSVADGVTGALVPPHDPDALARKITSFIKSPEVLKKMSEQAIRRVNGMFTWELVAKKMQTLYEQVINAKQPVYEKSHIY